MKNRYIQFITHSKKLLVLVITISMLFTACEDFLEIEAPRNEISADALFSSDLTANAAMNGVYAEMNNGIPHIFDSQLEQFTGIAGDEVDTYNVEVNDIQIAENTISIENTRMASLWSQSYKIISFANTIIGGVQNSTALSTAVKNQLLGEALFFRAFSHFHLVNLFGEIPFANTSDVSVLNTLPKASIDEVYDSIITDLLEAKSLMADNYEHANGKRVRANKSAAIALLARTYLYAEQWDKAEIEATAVINNTIYMLEPDVNNVFLSNSHEAILKLANSSDGGSTGYAYAFALFVEGDYGTLPPGGYYSTYGAYALKEGLKNAFEPNDARYVNWVGVKTINSDVWYYSHKYKKSGFNASSSSLPNEDFVLLRLAEQYLIRAEARAQQDNISGAQEDVNVLRTRAGLANTTATAKEALLEAVAQERRIELMVEGGHRWYDLKRTGKIDQVLSPLKADWQSTDALFPIPLQEILNNDNLTQNPGY